MKTAQFYCEQCKKPVSQDTKRCPFCGIYFSAIKCPECSFAGEPALFSDGCPLCGYTGKTELTTDKKKVRKNRNLPEWFYTGSAILLITFLIVLLAVYLKI